MVSSSVKQRRPGESIVSVNEPSGFASFFPMTMLQRVKTDMYWNSNFLLEIGLVENEAICQENFAQKGSIFSRFGNVFLGCIIRATIHRLALLVSM